MLIESVIKLIIGTATFLAHHRWLLVPVVALFVIGSAIPGRKMTTAGLRSRHGIWASPLIALLALIVGSTWLYKNRRNAGRAMVVVTVAGAIAVWAVAVTFSPRGWKPWLVIGGCALAVYLVLPGGPISRIVGNQSIEDWWKVRDLRRKLGHAADTVLAGATVHGIEAQPDGTLVANVQLPAGSKLDQLHGEGIESALAHERMPAPVVAVDVAPGPKAGQGIVTVRPTAVLPVWETVAGLDNALTVPEWEALVSEDPFEASPFGPCVFADGAVGTCMVPPGFPHVLIGGATGAGKSAGFLPAIGASARKRHRQMILFDPMAVEFSPWEPCALEVYAGQAECYAGLQWVLQLMARRQQVLHERGIRHWRVGKDGPGIDVFIDELADLTLVESVPELPKGPDGKEITVAKFCAMNMDAIKQIVRKARKFEIRLWAATQRADADQFKNGGPRDNFGFRVAYLHGSKKGSDMILGEDDDRPSATKIPRMVPGGAYVRLDAGLYVAARSHFIVPAQRVDTPHEIITVAAEEMAARYAHLRNPKLTYQLEN